MFCLCAQLHVRELWTRKFKFKKNVLQTKQQISNIFANINLLNAIIVCLVIGEINLKLLSINVRRQFFIYAIFSETYV